MRYKSKVLEQHPDARLVAIDRNDDGTPRYQRVVAGPESDLILDIHDTTERWGQNANNAWRSAYYYLVRQRRAAAGDALVASVAAALLAEARS
jgi:hypothetical protein